VTDGMPMRYVILNVLISALGVIPFLAQRDLFGTKLATTIDPPPRSFAAGNNHLEKPGSANDGTASHARSAN
jgi:hypothetical protein